MVKKNILRTFIDKKMKVEDEFMIKRTIFIIPIVFLCTTFFISSCGNTKSIGSEPTVEQAKSAIKKDKKAKAKAQRKAKRKAERQFWSMQTKQVKKRIRKTNRKRRREARRKRGCIF